MLEQNEDLHSETYQNAYELQVYPWVELVEFHGPDFFPKLHEIVLAAKGVELLHYIFLILDHLLFLREWQHQPRPFFYREKKHLKV